eukprot:ANDGO_05554.mRNA.1 Protein YIPF5 homolog
MSQRLSTAIFDDSDGTPDSTSVGFADYGAAPSSMHGNNGINGSSSISSSGGGNSNSHMKASSVSSRALHASESLGQLPNSDLPFDEEEDYANEPPLLEELGIHPAHIANKTLAVLNPFSSRGRDTHVFDDSDLAGPLLFCAALGFALLLRGKIHFGMIYGVGMMGCLGMYSLLNLMMPAGLGGIDVSRTVAVLGYSLLPIVLLVLLLLVVPVSSAGMTVAIMMWSVVSWSTYAASQLFVSVCGMAHQKWLVAYPVALVYTCFALMAVY